MLGQLDLYGRNMVEVSIQRIKTFCPPEGYYVCFSGGKDSQCVLELVKMAGVPYDAHYNVTSVDPPELIHFIKEQYPEVIFEYPRDKDGKRITMWNLIEHEAMPPTRRARYCCEKLKEWGGAGRLCVTGVRWAESVNRMKNQGMVTLMGKSKKTQKLLTEVGADFTQTNRGWVVLNLDNDESRRAVELCYRTRKTLVNPIIDWEETDVWEFLNEWVKVPHCKLYDEGFTRIGCIGCPLQRAEGMKRDFARWPKYKEAYLKAFEKMLINHPDFNVIRKANGESGGPVQVVDMDPRKRAEEAELVMKWWLEEL